MLVTYRNQLAVIGGFDSRDNDLLAVTSPRVLLLDNNTGKWVDGPPLGHARGAGGAAVVGEAQDADARRGTLRGEARGGDRAVGKGWRRS
jgi:hypothetical protein